MHILKDKMRLIQYLLCISIIAYEVVSVDMECLYWFYADTPYKHNPCSDNNGNTYVPENATILTMEQYYDHNN